MAQSKIRSLKFTDKKTGKTLEFKVDFNPQGPKVKGARYV